MTHEPNTTAGEVGREQIARIDLIEALLGDTPDADIEIEVERAVLRAIVAAAKGDQSRADAAERTVRELAAALERIKALVVGDAVTNGWPTGDLSVTNNRGRIADLCDGAFARARSGGVEDPVMGNPITAAPAAPLVVDEAMVERAAEASHAAECEALGYKPVSWARCSPTIKHAHRIIARSALTAALQPAGERGRTPAIPTAEKEG